ncbi:hypothetical protein ACX0G7_17720 [Flavitalea antarctica]
MKKCLLILAVVLLSLHACRQEPPKPGDQQFSNEVAEQDNNVAALEDQTFQPRG